MTRFIIIAVSLLFGIANVHAREVTVTVNKLDASGIGSAIGVIVVQSSPQGVVLKPYLRGLTAGNYKFAIHENVGCTAGYHNDGSLFPGAGAGKIMHTLPVMFVNPMGEASQPITVSGMDFDALRGRTLVIYDQDQTTRIACGSLEDYK